MLTKKLNDNEFEIQIYDWVDLHDDYVCGHAKIDRDADEDSDLSYWMFYPVGDKKPMSAGSLRRISEFVVELNKDSQFGALVLV